MGALCYPEFVLKPDMPVGVAGSGITDMATPLRVEQETM